MPIEPNACDWLVGVWDLEEWRRITGDDVAYPLGKDASGILIYSDSGRMSVHLSAAHRPSWQSTDPLAGEESDRAAAYSTYLAYWGRYEVRGDAVVHHIEDSLFPSWSGEDQQRPFTHDVRGDREVLVLSTSPATQPGQSSTSNQLTWSRPASS